VLPSNTQWGWGKQGCLRGGWEGDENQTIKGFSLAHTSMVPLSLKRRYMVNPMSPLALQHLQWYDLWRSQGIHTFCALWCKTFSRKWDCVYTGPPALTYCQPIMSLRCYTEPSALLQNLRGAQRCSTELNLASACLCRLSCISLYPAFVFGAKSHLADRWSCLTDFPSISLVATWDRLSRERKLCT
jgi:hypothetical protein